jgi:hypothetical protein
MTFALQLVGMRRPQEVAMAYKAFSSGVDRALGVFGLLLIVVVARLAEWDHSNRDTAMTRLCGFVARRVIDGVSLIGWIVDRLPLPGSPVIARSGSPARASCQPV